MASFPNRAFRVHPVSITTNPWSKLQGTFKVKGLLMQQKKVTNIREWKQTEAIWLSGKNSICQENRLRWHSTTVSRQSISSGINGCCTRDGSLYRKKTSWGRNNAHMSREEEERFLGFLRKQASGGHGHHPGNERRRMSNTLADREQDLPYTAYCTAMDGDPPAQSARRVTRKHRMR
jgi:hypothetical protein